ncbi:MAG TPA: 3-deoxy-D-manno-octulosonic acid transferase [Hyphomonas atlantica]|nr:3-deoxy-D-manno-octulosonic acid transferase [Hyphomonas atlantica]|tara:strand:- start:3137 stop:4399 length:1263 start_codon:yes stop_codon:yes gene_type:complete
MTAGIQLYRTATRAASPFLGGVLKRRARAGKEDYSRINERLARNLPRRMPGGSLVWLHGASVGESQLLLELGQRLLELRPDLMLLFTSQTQTSARLLGPVLPERAIHLMAPLDTPGIARRFIRHWQPDLCIFGEGEIWPNLILEAERAGAKRALVNGRMTDSSADGWNKLSGAFKRLVGRFDVVLAADTDTARRLETLLGEPVQSTGNMKSALPPPSASEIEIRRLRENFLADRRCILAASTHDGEEAIFLDALKGDDTSALIIAPRHPDRGNAVELLLKERGLTFARRSRGEVPTPRTRILLADTMGEMGLWYRLANSVFLGGGHTPGVGGHNPLEPVRLGLPVVTGPDVFNFATMMDDLEARKLIRKLKTPKAIAKALQSMAPPSQEALQELNDAADAPMALTLAALVPLLPEPGLLQ